MGTAAKPTRENRTITVDFQNETTYVQLLGDGKAFLELVMAFILSIGLSAQASGDLPRRRVPDASLPLCPCPLGWSHHLAHPVYEVQSGVHRAAALRLMLSPDPTGGGSRCPLGYTRWAQLRVVCGHLPYLPDGPLSLDLCARLPEPGGGADTVWSVPAHVFPRR